MALVGVERDRPWRCLTECRRGPDLEVRIAAQHPAHQRRDLAQSHR
jgi:hypothetical protein